MSTRNLRVWATKLVGAHDIGTPFNRYLTGTGTFADAAVDVIEAFLERGPLVHFDKTELADMQKRYQEGEDPEVLLRGLFDEYLK